jgi:hypothetical protein
MEEYEAPAMTVLGSVHDLTQGSLLGLLSDGLLRASPPLIPIL